MDSRSSRILTAGWAGAGMRMLCRLSVGLVQSAYELNPVLAAECLHCRGDNRSLHLLRWVRLGAQVSRLFRRRGWSVVQYQSRGVGASDGSGSFSCVGYGLSSVTVCDYRL
jgi:hypothetical protein